ncbi:MAG: GTPase ObgE [Bdellovibrionales bacterium]
MKFIDEVTIEVASGHGGPGCVSFRREKFVPRGGPDGGDGGCGGSVIFKSSSNIQSLLDLKIKTKYRAPDGDPGGNQKRSGLDGVDLIIPVPPGTVLKTPSGAIIKDIGPNETFLFLKGGLGGKGNPFYKSSVNQAPSVAQKGLPGESATVHLELKLLADIGIIGFPNAGKSTLISHISAAKPKIADYPFTTLIPNLGVVRFGDEKTYIVADMPGLIKGAHKGVGLGTRFLKHIERTKFFVHVIDVSGMSERDPVQDFKDINFELKMYDKEHSEDEDFAQLSGREQIVVLNKVDVIGDEVADKLVQKFKKLNVKVIPISAATGKNLNDLKMLMGKMVFNGAEKEIQNYQAKIIKSNYQKETFKKVTKASFKEGKEVKTATKKKSGIKSSSTKKIALKSSHRKKTGKKISKKTR